LKEGSKPDYDKKSVILVLKDSVGIPPMSCGWMKNFTMLCAWGEWKNEQEHEKDNLISPF